MYVTDLHVVEIWCLLQVRALSKTIIYQVEYNKL
jgi:hypothetical protein